jgi:hypothetical protein
MLQSCFGVKFCGLQVPASSLDVEVPLLFDFTSHFIHTSSFNTNMHTHMNAKDVSLRLCDVGFWIQSTSRF